MTMRRRENMTDDEFREWLRCNVRVAVNECWEWQGNRNADNYGRVMFAGTLWLAHRVFYVMFVGDITDGKQVNHKCNNPPCCNPEHLYAGTHQRNMRDRSRAITGTYMRRTQTWTKLTEGSDA